MSRESQEDVIEAYVQRVYARQIECAYNRGLRDGMDAVRRELKVTKSDLPSWWPRYRDGELIMPGDHATHPDMHGVNTITDVVYGIHGVSVCCYGGFKTMKCELFTKKEIN